MFKKMVAMLSLVTISFALATCSSAKTTPETKVESTKETSKVAKEEKATSKGDKLEASTITYLSDEEINAVQTIGDFKNAFQSLNDSYLADFEGLIAKVPEEAKTALEPFKEQLDDILASTQDTLAQQFSDFADSDLIPEEARQPLIDSLFNARDEYQRAMHLAYDQMNTALAAMP